jgi:DNA-directed RNA polymerase subunit RPC12/RpoP
LIGLAILFSSGHWWPGILVLIGLSMVFGSFFREEKPSESQNQPPPYYEAPVMPPAPAPVEQIHRVDLLPLTCTHCGGPIRSHEVTWTGAQSAACPYCGSSLQMKKP